MNNNIEDFNKSKQILLNQYSKIIENNILSTLDITKEDLEKKADNLKNNRFIVSVSGQMNSGKSTLLNSYIFGRNILPHDDMTQTAKLTIINYSETPYFEPIFYTQEEWDDLKKDYRKQGNEDNYLKLKEEIKLAESRNININNFIFIDQRTPEKIYDLDRLKEYVAVTDGNRGGKYTTFVNYVNLYFPNDILKDITIVDTPGINDPNKKREEITLKWIGQSDAVIYVTFVGAAITDIDISYIDKHLLGVPTDKRIIVVNKSDLAEDLNTIKNWVDTLTSDEKLKNIKIFDDKQSVVYVCSLGELIRRIEEDGCPLEDELIFFKDKTDFKKFILKANNKIDEFGKLVEEKIISKEGNDRLRTHTTFISSIFGNYNKYLESETIGINAKMSLWSSNEETLKEEKDNIIRQQEELLNKWDEYRYAFDQRSVRIDQEIFDLLKYVKDNVVDEIFSELKKIDEIDHFKHEVIWIVKNAFENNGKLLYNKTIEITHSVNKDLKSDIDDFIDTLSKYKLFSRKYLKLTFAINTNDIIELISENATKKFCESEIENIIDNNVSWFKKLWPGEGSNQNIRIALKNNVREFCDQSFMKSINNKLRDTIINTFKKLNMQLEEKSISLLDERKHDIDSILNNLDKVEVEKKSLLDKLRDIDDKKILINNFKKELEIE